MAELHEAEIKILQRKRDHAKPYIRIVGQQHAATLRALYTEGKLKVTEVKHQSAWPPEREIDFGNIESTRTYQDRVHVTLEIDYTISLTVEDGDLTYGGFRNHRCTFKLEGNWWLFKPFVQAIEHSWVRFTRKLVDNEVLADLEERRRKIALRVLGGSYPKELLNGV